MKIQRIWATLIGAASFTIGVLSSVPGANIKIPTLDAVLHIITGLIFIGGAWIKKGGYASVCNLGLGVFYIVWGVWGGEWPHIIVGVISSLVSISFNTTPK